MTSQISSIHQPIALIQLKGSEDYLGCTQPFKSNQPRTQLLDSAVIRLVSAVYAAHVGQAHHLLRGRILSSVEANEVDRLVVQLCAGKLSFDAVIDDDMLTRTTWLDAVADDLALAHRVRAEITLLELEADSGSPREFALQLKQRLELDVRDPSEKLPVQNRLIAAGLLDPDGNLRVAARNTAGLNRVRHAEVNLIDLAEQAGLLPLQEGWEIITTLSPCRMCAVLVAAAYADETRARLRYLEEDQGRYAQHTALHRLDAMTSL